MVDQKCTVCGSAAPYTCSRCNSAHYCNRDHQRLDYSEHKLYCTNYRVNNHPEMGEHIVASCIISPGSRILKEEPFLVGPMANSDLVCLTCYAPIVDEDFYKCPDCSWPMCSRECSYSDPHTFECEILAKDKTGVGIPNKKGETPRYDLIMLLRGLLLKETNPRGWKWITTMASHADIRKHDGDPFHEAAVRYFSEVCNVGEDMDTIHQVRGAIMTNCLIFKGENNTNLRGLYATIRLFNHSCIPNVHLTTTLSGEIEARAAVKIEKNSQLCICYTGTMEPLWKRQQYLSEVYKFQCKCSRCTDPTELGTYFSSPRCLDCRSLMLPPGDGSVNSWVCEGCSYKYELIDVLQEVSEWTYRMDMNDVVNEKTPKQLEKEIDRVQSAFNPHHYVPLQFTQFLLKILQNNTYECLKLRLDIWENHLELYNILEPGITRRRGMTLYQIGVTLLAMTKAGVDEKDIWLPRVPRLLSEASSRLYDAIGILQFEPQRSHSRQWLNNARDKLRELEEYRGWLLSTGVIDCAE